MMRVLEKRFLRKTFRPKRNIVKGEWKSLYKEELCYQYSNFFLFF
jgi:hypothetical protein